MKGEEVLTMINVARGALGLGLLPGLVLSSCEHDNPVGCLTCAIEAAIGCELALNLEAARYELRYDDREQAGRVAKAIGVELEESSGIAVPEAIDSLLTADGFGLTFLDRDACLKGWIEPTDDGQTLWDLHLMPGHGYPPGSESVTGVVKETVFDSARYLNGLLLGFDPPEDEPRRPVALFLAGGPLSGKTTVLGSLAAESHELIPTDGVVVDPKLIREQLPEWAQLYGARAADAAERVYEECCDVARQLTAEAVRLRRDLIIDGVGASGERQFAALLEIFDALGYDVRVLLVDTPAATAELRNLARAERDGLLIEREELAAMHREVSARFDEWKEGPWRWEMFATE
jgi:hypothetical protein